ncbi:MAG: hypothetical protein R2710_15900 [Acidimicrobiales bacterium]
MVEPTMSWRAGDVGVGGAAHANKPVEPGPRTTPSSGWTTTSRSSPTTTTSTPVASATLWGSAILPWAGFFIAAAVLPRHPARPRNQAGMNFGGAPLMPLMMGIGLFSFALFTHLRGTIINNIWWVIVVTSLSTALGLAVAKLADGAKFEPMAKSFVFMPMAISFVSASIIWRLMMYQAS